MTKTDQDGCQLDYDEAVEYLTDNPDQIKFAWLNPYSQVAGCLFKIMGPTGTRADLELRYKDRTNYGCLTQVKGYPHTFSVIDGISKAKILDDDNIPSGCDDITIEHLPVFANYQKQADAIRQKH